MMKSMDKGPETEGLAGALKQLHRPGMEIALIVHVNPDGDALGSALGLSRLLENMGHNCLVISPNDFPDFLGWMPGAGRISRLDLEKVRVSDFVLRAGIVFIIDCNELDRISDLKKAYLSTRAFRIMIDHHPQPALKVDYSLSETWVSSTSELVLRFIENTGLQRYMDAETATCLFTGIMTDTGCFSYNSSNRETYDAVAKLLDYGIDKDGIYYRVYDNFTFQRMRLLGFTLNEKMEVVPGYAVALISLTREELARYDFRVGDTEGFVNYPLSIKGIRLSVLFIEKEDHIKVSLRSKGGFSVNALSRKHFNGGGHANASGGESLRSMEETLRYFRSILPEYRDQLSADDR